MFKTPAAARAALLQALAAFIAARESLDTAAQMHLQIVCDPDSIPSQKDLADTKLAEFERAEELALAALVGAYRDYLAANEVREVVLDGHRLQVPDALPRQTATAQDAVSIRARFSDFLNGSR